MFYKNGKMQIKKIFPLTMPTDSRRVDSQSETFALN